MSSEKEHHVLIVGACQPPGTELAHALAMRGARVVALGTDAECLRALAMNCTGRIEPLAMRELDRRAFDLLGASWGTTAMNVAINLMPLYAPRALEAELRRLGQLMRATAPALFAGQGALINVVAHPADPLDLPASGMVGAFRGASAVLNAAMTKHGIRSHLVVTDAKSPNAAIPVVRFLAGPSASGVAPQEMRSTN